MFAVVAAPAATAIGAACSLSSAAGVALAPFGLPLRTFCMMQVYSWFLHCGFGTRNNNISQAPMAISVISILACLKLQRMAKTNMGWDGSFETLPQPQQSIIWFLSYMQTVPTVSIWLAVSVFGRRNYYDKIPLPSTVSLSGDKPAPALYIGKSKCLSISSQKYSESVSKA